jgi:carbon storage regulator
MLVLSRKASQRITIGDSIVITVVRVESDRVRIGIEAPREVRVMRQELGHEPAGGVSPFGMAAAK